MRPRPIQETSSGFVVNEGRRRRIQWIVAETVNGRSAAGISFRSHGAEGAASGVDGREFLRANAIDKLRLLITEKNIRG